MKKHLILTVFVFLTQLMPAQNEAKQQIESLLDRWHKAAAEANFKAYFELMADDAIFIGTDATENWTKKEFEDYARPHFEKGKAWSFSCLERHIYFNSDKSVAWFDELLDTRMKICRGSGVLTRHGNSWKISQYVLSMTIPNDATDQVIKAKSIIEDKLIESIKAKK